MRHQHTCATRPALAALTAILLAACAGSTGDERVEPRPENPPPVEPGATGEPAPGEAPAEAPRAAPKPAKLDPLRHRDDLAPHERLLVVIDGEERVVALDAALAAGYTPVDFTTKWTPYIFQPVVGPDGEVLENRYRNIYLGLANDQTDGDGRALPDNELNFLEVFGIPPSMGVIRKRFIEDADKACHAAIDYPAIAAVESIPWEGGRLARKAKAKAAAARRAIDRALKDANVETFEALAVADPKKAASLEDEREVAEMGEGREKAFAEIEKRLACDEHDRDRYKHKTGQFDNGLRMALRRFQRKHKIYEYANFSRETMEMLGKPPIETNFLAFERVLTERVVAATHIIEDGTAQTGDEVPTWTAADGTTRPLRNLVDEFVGAAKTQLGLDTPEKVLAFFQRHPAEDLAWLRVGVRFPELPEYYSPQMDLSIVIDRGDVWYDLPYNDKGKEIAQPRARLPKLSLYLNYNGQRIRLVRWPTTIGGWRKDLAKNGYEYMRYKGSDVGDRVIRKIISGPTWVPPESTPLSSLAKRKWINGQGQGIVNYDELGPGYLSAYGLVAGYFVIPNDDDPSRDVDRGIRAHGSSDYMSIQSSQRFSHGCHRLLNHLSVRLYGFILNHRNHTVAGDQKMNHSRQFYHGEQVFEVRLPTRGFAYFLDPPLPVTVTEGRIRGKRQRPYEDYVKIPGQEYPAHMPGEAPEGEGDDRAGGGAAMADEDDDA
ncbi:MAG: hypothetical protein H6703_03605 [Myxococcales bacterium]|nr:hypothetical protein [Myxococcales bacterium]MCB9541517.1 hypothetical protein [Myxococcales bacterium]